MPKTHESILLHQYAQPSAGYKPTITSTMILSGYFWNRKIPYIDVGDDYYSRSSITAIRLSNTAPGDTAKSVNLAADGHSAIYFFLTPEEPTILYFYPEYDVIKVEDDSLKDFFSYFSNLSDCSDLLNRIDRNKAYNCDEMFISCRLLESIDLGKLKVSSARKMFENCDSLTAVSNVDTSACTNMGYMFYQCTSLQDIGSSSEEFDTSSCLSMDYMFAFADVGSIWTGFDTSSCTSFSRMFYESVGATSLDCSSFDASNVTDFRWMFYLSSIKTLYLGNFNTSSGRYFEYMLRANKLTTIYCKNDFDISKQYDTSKDVFSSAVNGGSGTYSADEQVFTSEMAKVDSDTQKGYFTDY